MNGITRPVAVGSHNGTTFRTEVSFYDRVFGGLIASLVLGLFLFVTLLLVWWFGADQPRAFSNLTTPFPPNPDLITPIENLELSVVEFDGSESKAFTESIEMSGASIAELFEKNVLDSEGTGIGIAGDTDGLGTGIGRTPGPAQASAAPNWSVIQEASNLESYQRKLDYFGIEIGAVHKSNDKIWRIANLSGEKAVTESSRSAESKRRYFVNQRKRLLQWDRQTIAQAGVDLQDMIAVHFYPDELIAQMQQLIEARYQDQASDLAEVTFKIVGTDGNFHFEIDAAQFKN